MYKGLLCVLIFFIGFTGKSNANDSGVAFTPEEKAYLFHVVKRSPVLERNIGGFFDYRGDTIRSGHTINYDSIEQIIIMEPSLLKIDFDAISNASPGILAELSTKLALWDLHNELKKGEEVKNGELNKGYRELYDFVVKYAPEPATRGKKKDKRLIKKLEPLLDPNLPMNEKIDLVESMGSLDINQQLYLLKLVNQGIVNVVDRAALDMFERLGGDYNKFENELMAAGEGSSTSGLLDETEKKENGRPDKKRPAAIGLFTYRFKKDVSPAGEEEIHIKPDPIETFKGYEGGKTTNVHLSLWGFNSFFQTTVVLRNGNKSYLLFANQIYRELTPDSTFGRGKTYYDHIAEVKNEMIAEVEEKLYKENGLYAKVEILEEKLAKTSKLVEAAEKDLYKAKMKADRKKAKEFQIKYMDAIDYRTILRKKLKEAEINLQAELYHLDYLQDYLYYMETNLGPNVQNYTKHDSLYIFDDGSTFNAHTQNFKFNDLDHRYGFKVRLISIGSKPMSKRVDEVQLYVNVHEKIKSERVHNQFRLTDVFTPNSYQLDQLNLDGDQLQTLDEALDYLLSHQSDINTYLTGEGIGMKRGNQIIPATGKKAEELRKYPDKNAKEREEFKDLRTSVVDLIYEGGLFIRVQSFTDPVRSDLGDNEALEHIRYTQDIAQDNDLLSALRTWRIFELMIDKMQERLANKNDSNFSNRTWLNDYLEEVYKSARVKVGNCQIDYTGYQRIKNVQK